MPTNPDFPNGNQPIGDEDTEWKARFPTTQFTDLNTLIGRVGVLEKVTKSDEEEP